MTTLVTAPFAIDLHIGGMTCASCAARVEKKLNKLDGVTAEVNFATETAHVTYSADLAVGDLIETVEKTGYTATPPSVEEQGPEPSVLPRLIASAALTVPVIVLAMSAAMDESLWQWVTFALVTPVILWCAYPFHRSAAINARHGAATMDTLISLGALTSYLWSIAALFTGAAMYFEVGATLTTFLLAGRYFEQRAKRRAGSALRALAELGAKDVAVLGPDGTETRVPIARLRTGDLFVVRPGERVATDGVVTEGRSAIDASLLTGESLPVEVGAGDAVTGATTNVGGRVVVRATRVGAATQLAHITRLVTEAQRGKAAAQRLADRISAVFVPVVIALSIATFAAWLLLGHGAGAAVAAAVAVLIVACPCALGLATPTALLAGTGRGASMGILVRGPQVLEATRRVDTIVFDKTGTLTTGVMTVTGTRPVAGVTTEELLRYAAAVEHASAHPIARAIAGAAEGRPDVTDFESVDGLGARGVVDGRHVIVGRPALLESHGITIPPLSAATKTLVAVPPLSADAETFVAVAWDGAYRGSIAVSDEIRPGARDAVAGLRRLGLRPVLLTGDNASVAGAVAAGTGIDEVIADVMPAGKLDVINALRRDGRIVAMVGDGVNDAAALAAADLGIAMGGGTEAAIAASDLTLVRDDLFAIEDALRLSRATLGTIKGNLFWAFGYNTAAIPLAAAGLVTPVVAGGAMALSSVFVLANSLRLFRVRLGCSS